MSLEPDRPGTPLVAVPSTTGHCTPGSAPSRLALGVLGILIATLSLLGGAANAAAAAVAPVADQQVTAVTDDGVNPTGPEATAVHAGGDDGAPSETMHAIGTSEHDDTEESGGKGRLKFAVGGVLVAIVIAVVVVVVLRRRGDDEY